MLPKTKTERHSDICKEINALYARKNHDYGDSFHQTFTEEGMAMPRIRLGDVAWYLAVLCDAIGSDLDTVMEENLKKLEQRYPEGFDPYRSQHRNELGG